ncbi:predicted protein [Naegleria gruberi]|uniref:Predicted protein n=1 Tax=Naegleria gruberi TaxID=5762 RepID=D2W1V7_NAEGR|nr:uncharacterized protein NAEGRDRAFT_75285 [Naegleria gruberi]EFC36984.1 predicted protein [Naegleria gruberi]|eukprot:XP_002669728.1 predicted protein [Naegleria gruberi strain NEG-M]
MQEVFEKAKLSQPSIIVIDDLEFCDWNSNSEKEISVLKEFLQSMYDRESRVIVLVISSTPWNINPAVRKIFKRRFHIPLPDKEKRIEILRDAFRNSSIQDDEIEEISTMCDGYSYADLMCVVRDSQMNIIRNALMATNNSFNISLNALSQPTKSDVIKSLQTIKSSVTIQEEAKHLQFQQDFYPGSSAQFHEYIKFSI